MSGRAVLSLVMLAACGRIGFDASSGDPMSDADTDAGGSDSALGDAPACVPGTWGPLRPQLQLQSSLNDWEPALHPGGLILVYALSDAVDSDLVVATRPNTSADFGPPAAIPVAATGGTFEYGPMWSPDGTELTFKFDDGTVSEPRVITYLGGTSFSGTYTIANMPPDSFSWDITPDGLELFYTTTDAAFDYDLHHATRASPTMPWVDDDAVANLTRVGMKEGWPSYDAARGVVHFERDGVVGPVLAEARRPTAGARFELTGETSIVQGMDGDPDLSPDGLTLVFASVRSGSIGYDIYLSTRSCL